MSIKIKNDGRRITVRVTKKVAAASLYWYNETQRYCVIERYKTRGTLERFTGTTGDYERKGYSEFVFPIGDYDPTPPPVHDWLEFPLAMGVKLDISDKQHQWQETWTKPTPINFKELARTLLQGWCDRHNNDHPELEQVFIDSGFKPEEADMLSMFSHWSSDLLSLFGTSADIRLTMELNASTNKIEVAEVPEPPAEFTAAVNEVTHLYWSPGQHMWSRNHKEMVWHKGSWMLYRDSIPECEAKAMDQ